MLYEHEDLYKLIPQRDPIVMIDKMLDAAGDVARTGLTVRADCIFVDADESLTEPGLIEHIAQSASALLGHKALLAGQPLPVGYIGEVKKFHCYRCPVVGDELTTTITLGPEVGGITIITGETRCGDALLADTQMKLYTEGKE